MANSTFRFELFIPRTDKEGKAPIRLIYQISGIRKFISTNEKVYLQCWDKENKQVIYLDKRTAKRLLPDVDYAKLPLAKDVEEINDRLEQIIADIKKIEKRFELDKITYSPDMIVEAYHQSKIPETKKDQSKTVVQDYITRYIDEQCSVKAKGSLVVYKSLKKHLEDYGKYLRSKILFSQMDKSFFANFQTFLIEKKNLRNTTAAKQLSTLKTILNYADSCGLEVNHNYKQFTIRRESLDVLALTQAEFDRLFYFDLSDYSKKVQGFRLINNKPEIVGYATLEKARDLFCFACVTGLRFSDMHALRHENIKNNAIRITVVKTKQQLFIPLSNYALTILKRYKDNLRPLPTLSNQRLNDYIKVLAKIAKIDDNVEKVRFKGVERIVENYPKYELIGAHTGRKTFCTLSLEKNMSAEQVMAISGHKDYKSFKRYVNITNENKKQAVLKAWVMPKILSIAK